MTLFEKLFQRIADDVEGAELLEGSVLHVGKSRIALDFEEDKLVALFLDDDFALRFSLAEFEVAHAARAIIERARDVKSFDQVKHMLAAMDPKSSVTQVQHALAAMDLKGSVTFRNSWGAPFGAALALPNVDDFAHFSGGSCFQLEDGVAWFDAGDTDWIHAISPPLDGVVLGHVALAGDGEFVVMECKGEVFAVPGEGVRA